MAQEVLVYLSLIIAISAVMAIIARMIRQPPIIAYLISGIIVGPLAFGLIGPGNPSAELLQTSARIGVAFLLFIVGMSLDFRLLRDIGKVSAVSGIIEMVVVGVAGFFAAFLLGFSNIASFYIGAAITFSSTVVVVKILSDKKEMSTLHGKIALGILIVQDIFASILLMVIPLLSSGGDIQAIGSKVLLAIIVIGAVFLVSGLFFNKFLNYLAKSQETLFIFAVSWALILAAFFSKLGFSIEIGALIAGMSLASTKYALDLESKIKPLRDFFVIFFFVFFGSQLTSVLGWAMIKNVVILSLLVMILKPLIVMITLKFFGYTKRTNFLVSLSLAQVSEFSLILIMLGFGLGQVSQDVMNIAVLVALITIGISAYAINFSDYLSNKISHLLNFFDGKIKVDEKNKKKEYDIVLFGYHRIGYKILETIRKLDHRVVIIDYNPKVVLSLNKQNIDAIYGDASNTNFLNDIDLDKAKLVISTIPDENSTLKIKEMLNEKKSKAVFIATAEEPRVALDLYEAGIDYVIIPHHLGGEYASFIIKQFGDKKDRYKKMGAEHFRHLKSAKNKSNYLG
jgi:Kef-type K+ transport system membrane component KefB